MNLTPTHILQLGVIPTQKVKDALTAWLYCRYLLLSLSLYLRLMYLLHSATFRASEYDEKALKGLIIMCCMQSSGLTFYFLGILGMVSNSDARRRLYFWSDRPPKVCIVLAWLGAYLPRNFDF